MLEDIDTLMREGFHEPPTDFTEQVMAAISAEPRPVFATRKSPLAGKWQDIALASASLLGLAQLVAFMFGIWLSASAG